MLEADILVVEESRKTGVVGSTQIERDAAVEETHGNFVELLVDEANVFQVGGSRYLLISASSQ